MKVLKISVLPVVNVVLFPDTEVIVHIVEQAYTRMVKDCVKNNIPLAISLVVEQAPSDICGIGIPEIIEEFENKTINIRVVGTGRVLLKEMIQNIPYPVIKAEMIIDKDEGTNWSKEKSERLNVLLTEWCLKNILDNKDRNQFLEKITSVKQIVDNISMYVVNDWEIKQLLLKNNSLSERIRILNLLLKENNPFSEDLITSNAIKEFEKLKDLIKVAH